MDIEEVPSMGDTQQTEIRPVDVDTAIKEAKADIDAIRRYVKVLPDTGVRMKSNGKVGEHVGMYGKLFDFFLVETVTSGENKVFSVKTTNPFAQQLLNAIKEGKLNWVISRTGAGNDTKYTLLAEA